MPMKMIAIIVHTFAAHPICIRNRTAASNANKPANLAPLLTLTDDCLIRVSVFMSVG